MGPLPPVFDAHLHVVDPAFPLVPNDGYLPPAFTVDDYRTAVAGLDVVGGAVVSGSFQAFDTTYLVDALERLGPGFVGVTNLRPDVPDDEIVRLHAAGVRAVRVNLFRGGSAGVADLDRLARRVHEVAGWHAEIYVDAADLPDLALSLLALPRVIVDHLGMSDDPTGSLLRLVVAGHGSRRPNWAGSMTPTRRWSRRSCVRTRTDSSSAPTCRRPGHGVPTRTTTLPGSQSGPAPTRPTRSPGTPLASTETSSRPDVSPRHCQQSVQQVLASDTPVVDCAAGRATRPGDAAGDRLTECSERGWDLGPVDATSSRRKGQPMGGL
jgi:hypothetical protein